MLLERISGIDPSLENADLAHELREMASEIGVPSGIITEKDITVTSTLLGIMRREYGDPSSDSYKPHHNEQHGLNYIKCFWTLWKPLHTEFPNIFDVEGFRVGMKIGAGHDLVYDNERVMEQPGENELETASLVYALLLEADYEEPYAERVAEGIVKSTVEFIDGLPVQTKIREGSEDPVGLIGGQADMDPILIEGPTSIFGTALGVWLEKTATPIKKALSNPAGITRFITKDEKEYADSRVAVLSANLKYYVEDSELRHAIVEIYREEFGDMSRRSLALINKWHQQPEVFQRMVDEAIKASRTAKQGLEQIAAVKRHMAELVLRFSRDER